MIIAIAVVAVILVGGFFVYKSWCSKPVKENIKRIEPSVIEHPIPSEPIPRHNTRESKTPALVLFYSEKCGHCVKMGPVWREFSSKVRKPGILDVFEFEASKNPEEIKNNKIAGFPTIRFYPEGYPGVASIEYKGNRSAESLTKFVMSGGMSS